MEDVLVPEGMRAAAAGAMKSATVGGGKFRSTEQWAEIGLRAALSFWKTHPIVPDPETINEILNESYGKYGGSAAQFVFQVAEWQRRMFCVPEPAGDNWIYLINQTSNSGKSLFACKECGYVTPAPTKNHCCEKPQMADAAPVMFTGTCPECGVDTRSVNVPCSHFSASGVLMPGHINPEMMAEIKDLLLPNIESGFFKPEVVNQRIKESFYRGQKSMEKK